MNSSPSALHDFRSTFQRFLSESEPSSKETKKEILTLLQPKGTLVRFEGASPAHNDNTLYFLPDVKNPGNLSNDSVNPYQKFIQDQIDYYAHKNRCFEFKLYSFVNDVQIENALKKSEFYLSRTDSLMYALATPESVVSSKSTIEVRRASQRSDFRLIQEVLTKVWASCSDYFIEQLYLEYTARDSRLDVFIAYDNGKAVSAGWVRHYGEISFFFGGSTLIESRGKGAYRALVNERILQAHARGAKFIVSESSADSEQVLTKAGFTKAGVGTVYNHDSFSRLPTLKNDLVELSPLKESEFDELYDVAKDPMIWEQHPKKERYQLEPFKEFFAKAIESQGALAIRDAKTKKIIGTSRYYDFDPIQSELTIGFTFLARAYWGGKYNRAIKHLMVEYALRHARKAIFCVDAHNFRSQKALEKIGASKFREVEEKISETKTRTVFLYQLSSCNF